MRTLALLLAGLLAACPESAGPDAGAPPDASAPGPDAGRPGVDAGGMADASLAPDAGVDPGVDLGAGVGVLPRVLVPGGTATIRYRGALAGGPAVGLHYGFNGWNRVPGPVFQTQVDGTGNTDFFLEQAMEPVAGGGWEATIALPPDARALHFVFFAPSGADRAWDSDGGRDWGREILFPYVGPLLSYHSGDDPSVAVRVGFHTGHACLGRVDYGPTEALGQSVREAAAGKSHALRLEGLAPGTSVHYRVACEGAGTSPLYRLRTPAAGATRATFAVLSDAQDDGERTAWGRVAAELAANHPEVELVLAAGDLAWNDRPGHWWSFFDQGRALFAGRALLASPGNHDTPTTGSNPDTSSFERWFDFDRSSGSELAYRVRYGPALFLALGSERPAEWARDSGAQYLFARGALADLGGASWAFAFWHVPAYNAGVRHFAEVGAFRDLTALFDGKVDWVFSGHEHLYQRMKPLRFSGQLVPGYGNGPSDGVGYLVLPPASAWPNSELVPLSDPKAHYRDRLAYPAPADRVHSELGFVKVRLDGRTLALEAYGMGTLDQPAAARVIDSTSYGK